MTQTQVAYLNHLETAKHNRITEAENYRSNVANEYLKSESNRITEEHYIRQDQETYRHNVMGENISWAQLQEDTRHHLRDEALKEFSNQTQANLVASQKRYYAAQTSYINTQNDYYGEEIAAKKLSAEGAYLRGKAAASQANTAENKFITDTVFRVYNTVVDRFQSVTDYASKGISTITKLFS